MVQTMDLVLNSKDASHPQLNSAVWNGYGHSLLYVPVHISPMIFMKSYMQLAAPFLLIISSTFPTVIIQPLSGVWLIWQGGYDWSEIWLLSTYALYILAGLCWLPVVWIQIQLKKMLQIAAASDTPIPPRYYKLFKLWFALGWPAFLGLVIVFFLMVSKPA